MQPRSQGRLGRSSTGEDGLLFAFVYVFAGPVLLTFGLFAGAVIWFGWPLSTPILTAIGGAAVLGTIGALTIGSDLRGRQMTYPVNNPREWVQIVALVAGVAAVIITGALAYLQYGFSLEGASLIGVLSGILIVFLTFHSAKGAGVYEPEYAERDREDDDPDQEVSRDR